MNVRLTDQAFYLTLAYYGVEEDWIKKEEAMKRRDLGYTAKVLLFFFALGIQVFAWHGALLAQDQYIPDRRADQFPTDPGYLFFPLPYSLPGIGEGIFWLGHLSNAIETTADITAIYSSGAAQGYIINLGEIPVIPNFLFFDGLADDLSAVTVNIYEARGMNTEKDAYSIVETNEVKETSMQLTATLFERRLNIFAGRDTLDVAIVAFRDSDGSLLASFDTPYRLKFESTYMGVQFDLTDSFQDPRYGVRGQYYRSRSPALSPSDPEYYVVDIDLQGYVPVGRINTLVLNYYQSDAVVTKVGVTDPAAIRQELGVVCPPGDIECDAALTAQVQNTIAERTNGTATTLGGRDRLRGYPQGRFSGGHMAFYGAEFRWNFTEEATPFDYFIWKDVRTGMQWAFFYEVGTVSETKEELWDKSRNTVGTGFRLVTASGSVYRADIGFGDEGSATTIFFFYPW